MPQPVLYITGSIAVDSTTRFSNFFGGDWNTTAALVNQVMSSPGAISNVHLELSVAPGAGKSRTITLQKNSVDTALTFTISDLAVTGSDTTHSVSFSAGDVLCWKSASAGGPAGAILKTWYFDITPTTPGISQFGQAVLSWSGANRLWPPGCLNPGGVFAGGSEYQNYFVVPTAGSFIAFAGFQNGAGTTATGFSVLLNLNGVDQDGAGGTVDTRVTFDFQSASSVSSGTFVLPVVAGDLVYAKCNVVGSPNTKNVSLCFSFKATNTSEYIIGFNLLSAQLGGGPNVNQYSQVMAGISSGTPGVGTTEVLTTFYNDRPLDITKFYLWLQNAPGVGQNREFTVRKGGVDQSLTVPISGTSFSGNDTVSGHKVRFVSGNTLSVRLTAVSSSPATTRGTFSLVAEFLGGGKNAAGGSSNNGKKGGAGGLNIQNTGGSSFLQYGNEGLDVGITS